MTEHMWCSVTRKTNLKTARNFLRKGWMWHLSVWSLPSPQILNWRLEDTLKMHQEKCKIYPKLIWPELSVWGPSLRHLVHNRIRQVLLRKFKRNISFSLFNRTFGQTVSSTKQFVLNSRISFLGINLNYFCCKNIAFRVVSFATTLWCRRVRFCCILLYFLVIKMKGFWCSNMNFAVINYVAPLLCWEMVLTFWYFRAGSENWWWRCLKQLEKVKVIPFEMTSHCWTSWTRVRQLSKCYRSEWIVIIMTVFETMSESESHFIPFEIASPLKLSKNEQE